jgi:large subunit ribosomal protein L11
MDFFILFNARTQTMAGKVIPVVISVYSDKSFEFITKTPPVAVQLKDAVKATSGSAEPNRKKIGSVTWETVETIAKDKMQDLNAFTLEMSMSMVAGTARSMGVSVTGQSPLTK